MDLRTRRRSQGRATSRGVQVPITAILVALVALSGCVQESSPVEEGSNGADPDADGAEDNAQSRQTSRGSASGSATSPSTDTDKTAPASKPIGQGDTPAVADLPPTVTIVASTVTGLVPLNVELVFEVTDPEGRDTAFHYDLGLGDEEGGTGTLTIEGSGTVTLAVQYLTPATYSITARADDGNSVGRDSVTIAALNGCPADAFVLVDDANDDGPGDDWEATCMTAHRKIEASLDRLHVKIYFVPGANVTDASSLDPPTGHLRYSEEKGIAHENRIVLEWDGEQYTTTWDRKTVAWQGAPGTDEIATWDGDHITVILPLADLDDSSVMASGDVLNAMHFLSEMQIDSLGSWDDGASLQFTDDDIQAVE